MMKMSDEIVRKAAKVVCATLSDDWKREGPRGLGQSYDPVARAVLEAVIPDLIREDREACALLCDRLLKPGEMQLRAGEMTAGEIRTAKAIVGYLAAAIRSRLKETSDVKA